MPSITQILIKEPYSKLQEVTAIKSFIDEKLLDYFRIDQKDLDPVYGLESCGMNPRLVGIITDMVVCDVFRKKKNIKYSLKTLIKEMDFVNQVNSIFVNSANGLSSDDIIKKHKPNLLFFIQQFDELLQSQDVEYDSMPIHHYLLLARADQWSRSNIMDQMKDVELAHQQFQSNIKSLKTLVHEIDSRVKWLLKDFSFKDLVFGHVTGDDVVSGNCNILADSTIIDNKSVKDMRIKSDWLFRTLFYTYLHNKIKNTQGHSCKIKQFGFLNWRRNYFHIRSYEFSPELTSLFDKLYKRIEKMDKSVEG